MDYPLAHERMNWLGDPALEKRVRSAVASGGFSHGWLLTGPPGVGKATFAYRIARAMLAPEALIDGETLAIDPAVKASSLIAARAHPDLYTAERRWDEKKARYETEISVDTIRDLSAFFARTASMGGWRVAIIDSADELNRNAANALLKVLEEPPQKTLLLLVCHAPGRLLATIRSRCRRLELRPLAESAVRGFLESEAAATGHDAALIAKAANGRPGYGLQLAAGEGGEAVAAMEDFFKASLGRADIAPVLQSLTGKAGDARWAIFSSLIMETLTGAARANAAGADVSTSDNPLALYSAQKLLTVWQEFSDFIPRAEALNLDRAQIILSMQRTLKKAI